MLFNSLLDTAREEKLKEFRSSLSEFLTKHFKGKNLENFGFRIIFNQWYGKQVLSEEWQDFPSWMKAKKGRNLERVGDSYHFKN
jgi:hypothetical protein